MQCKSELVRSRHARVLVNSLLGLGVALIHSKADLRVLYYLSNL